jgi:hypothetical protein
MIKILKYDYISKRDALLIARLLEKSTDYVYNTISVDDVNEYSIIMDGSIEGLVEGSEYYQLNHDSFYASVPDFINFYNSLLASLD